MIPSERKDSAELQPDWENVGRARRSPKFLVTSRAGQTVTRPIEYSVLILTKNEADNVRFLLPQLIDVLEGQRKDYEIILIDAHSTDGTADVASSFGARVFSQREKGYGAAFREGLGECRGEWIVTLDADHSHPPQFLRAMFANKEGADLLIASRYMPGGDAKMEVSRNILSRILSLVFGKLLGLPAKDLSSGFRMYRRAVLADMTIVGRDFDVLMEVLIRVVSRGYRLREIPFIYEPRVFGRSNARLVQFAVSYLRTLRRMWQLRNSIDAADYEERAYHSVIPLQRYWQRARTKHVLDLADRNAFTVDIGSGTSRIARSLPQCIALDRNVNSLRYLASFGVLAAKGDLLDLPLPSESVEQIVLSQVLQHIDQSQLSLSEVRRVMKSKGILIIATPDYSSMLWRFLERIYIRILPHSPGSLHRSRFTRSDVLKLLNDNGFILESERDIFGADRIYRARLK